MGEKEKEKVDRTCYQQQKNATVVCRLKINRSKKCVD